MKNLLYLCVVVLVAILAFAFGTFKASDTIITPDSTWASGYPAATAWQALIVSQEAAAERIFSATDNPQERAEGLDFLADLLALSLEMKVDKGDPAHPAFTNWMSDYRKVFGDVADAIYHTAEISPDFDYLIEGNIADAGYLGFQLYGKMPNGWNRAAANINQSDMQISEDGSFTLYVSATAIEEGVAGLKMSNDVHTIMVRQYFLDRDNARPSQFTIRTLNRQDPRPPSAEVHAAKLRDATNVFNNVVDGVFAMRDMAVKAPNSSNPPQGYDPDFAGIYYPTKDNVYFGTWFLLAADEALVLQGQAPEFVSNGLNYWSVSLQNRWMQSLDYSNHQTSLNRRDIKIRDDGSYRIVISHSAPERGSELATLIGDDNWMETTQHSEGILAIRYQLAESFKRPDIKLLKIR